MLLFTILYILFCAIKELWDVSHLHFSQRFEYCRQFKILKCILNWVSFSEGVQMERGGWVMLVEGKKIKWFMFIFLKIEIIYTFFIFLILHILFFYETFISFTIGIQNSMLQICLNLWKFASNKYIRLPVFWIYKRKSNIFFSALAELIPLILLWQTKTTTKLQTSKDIG